ncbi:MAG: hypothetical protein ACOZQL_23515 [Myxococcota bacterium]
MAIEQPPEVVAAFDELGLARDTPPEQLRRAYLRVIKTRKPEQDPEGFRRAREAFELLAGWFQFVAARAAAEAGPVAPTVDAPPAPEPVSAPPSEVTGWHRVQDLFVAGRVDEGRQLVQTLLAAGDAPPDPGRLVGLLLELQHAHPGAQARATLRAFLSWVERARLELLFARPPDRWVMLREFAKLPAEVPTEVEASLARFLLDGELEAALQRIELYTRENPAQADAAILPLSGASGVLHQLLTPVLNIELIARRDKGDAAPLGWVEPRERPPAEPAAGGSGRGLLWPALLVIFFLARLASFGGSSTTRTEYLPPPPPPRPLTVSPAPSVTPPAPAALTLGTVELTPMDELCRLSTPDCLASRGVRSRLALSDCLGARQEFGQLVNSNTLIGRSRAADALRAVRADLEVQLSSCGVGRK